MLVPHLVQIDPGEIEQFRHHLMQQRDGAAPIRCGGPTGGESARDRGRGDRVRIDNRGHIPSRFGIDRGEILRSHRRRRDRTHHAVNGDRRLTVKLRDPGQRDRHTGLCDPANGDGPCKIRPSKTARRRRWRQQDRQRAAWRDGKGAIKTPSRGLSVIVLVEDHRDAACAEREPWQHDAGRLQVRTIAGPWKDRYLGRSETGETPMQQVEKGIAVGIAADDKAGPTGLDPQSPNFEVAEQDLRRRRRRGDVQLVATLRQRQRTEMHRMGNRQSAQSEGTTGDRVL